MCSEWRSGSSICPASGWQSSVLTASNPSAPVSDPSLARDVPPETLVVRARTFEPSYATKAAILSPDSERPRSTRGLSSLVRAMASIALQPDPQVLWAPDALREGRALLTRVRHDVVVATGPPFSALLVGARLARAAGLPLVLDYRDEWDITGRYGENRSRDVVSRAIQERLQARALRRAELVIATTRRSAEALAAKALQAGSRARTRCIYNGYDADDFVGSVPPVPTDGKHRVVYVGTLWALTDAASLVAGVTRLARDKPERAAALELVFAGRRTPEQSAVLQALRGLPCRLTLLDYVEHEQAIGLMRGAGRLCLLLSDVPGAERVVPAKLFEYIAARRPILAVVPDGECSDILRSHPAALVVPPDRTDLIAEALALDVVGRAGLPSDWGLFDASPYSRAHLAGELADSLREVILDWQRQ